MLGQEVFDAIDEMENIARETQECLARRGRLNAVRPALQQRCSGVVFQDLNASARRRQGHT
jgi:hypothetical protein